MPEPLNHVTLTPAQEKLWDDTRAALVWKCPAFTHILYSMLDNVGSKQVALFTDDPRIPIAATDGSTLILNPAGFFKFNLYERLFVVAHEILHCVLNHCILSRGYQVRGKVAYPDGTELPYNHQTMNAAMDYVINAVLVKDGSGKMPSVGLHDPQITDGMDSFVDVYRKLFEQGGGKGKGEGDGNSPSNGPGGGQNGGHGGFDTHLEPGTAQGKDPGAASQDRNDGEWAAQVAQAAQSAKLQGKLPAGLERLINDMLNPTVDWRDKIKGVLARRLGAGGYDWLKADRRYIVRDIYTPARSGHGAECVVVGVDTSGSVSDDELRAFLGEVAGIMEEVQPRDLYVVWCDARVNRVDHISDPEELLHLKKPGGGGTDFRPVFDWIGSNMLQPDCLVYLTDGFGAFPDKPSAFPVIWGSTSKPGMVKYPFGDVVDIPMGAGR